MYAFIPMAESDFEERTPKSEGIKIIDLMNKACEKESKQDNLASEIFEMLRNDENINAFSLLSDYKQVWGDDNSELIYDLEADLERLVRINALTKKDDKYKSTPVAVAYGVIFPWSLTLACAFCVEAIKEFESNKSKDNNLSWVYIAEAMKWSSIVMTHYHYESMVKYKKSEAAKTGHAETHSLRNEVIEYWYKNIDHDLSITKTAKRLEKVFPLAFSTLRDYVSEAKKELKLHLASKP